MQAELRPAPIVRMLGVTAIVAAIIVSTYAALQSLPNFEAIMRDSSWIFADLVHIPQFAIPFVLICWITKGRLGEYGFNLKQKPPVFTHRRMLGLGALFGLLMSVRYISPIARNIPVDIPQPEETMFRGLIQTYLMKNLRGYIKIFGHDLHIGTVIGAIIWGMFHFINILVMPMGSVVFTVVLTTVAGLGMGYAYQETGSLLTTILVHNTMFGVPLTIGYILYWLL